MNIEEIKKCKEITKLYPYYRSDIFAAALKEAGLQPEQIVITRRDGSKGGYAHDISKVQIRYPYLYPDTPYIEIQTGAEGIYDNMPEDLFFIADHSHRERDKRHVISRIRDNRKRELDLRRIFGLFEVESDAFRVEMSHEEMRYQQAGTYSQLKRLFSHYWDVVSLMNNRELMRLLRVFPFVADMRGDYTKASDAISYILGISVEIAIEKVKVTPQNDEMTDAENLVLGVNFALCSNDEYMQERLFVTLSGIDRNLYPLYFDNKDYNRIVLFLTEMFVESTKEIDFYITCDVNLRECYIGDDENAAYFGLNTYL